MSQWTHVNAAIRFDVIAGIGYPLEEELGQIANWEDEDTSHWETTPLPCGSEGSLKYNIWHNPNASSVAKLVINFWGDLRDYDDVDYILKYFTNLTKSKKNPKAIRSGILEIDVEGEEARVYRFDSDEEKWILK